MKRTERSHGGSKTQSHEGSASSDKEGKELVAKRAPEEILRQEIHEGLESMDAPSLMLLLSGVSAGLELGFSPLMAAIMHSLARDLPQATREILSANCYAVGFIFVVLGRSELFTEQTTLAVLPVLNGNKSIAALLRLWCIVYVANLIGGAGFAALTSFVGPGLHLVAPETFGEIASQAVSYSAGTIFLSAVLTGWLMGLLSWLVAAGRDTMSQLLVVWLIATVIGLAHLHHAIEGSIQLMMAAFSGHGVGAGAFARFLFFTTIGNIVGGSVFVALIKFGHIAWASEHVGGDVE